MLTRQGWLVGGGALAVLVAGRVFGLVELYVVGAAVGLLLVACFAYVALSRLDLAAGRSVLPRRVHVGSPARAQIRLRNLRGSRTPVLRLLDPVSNTAGADLLVNPVRSGETVDIAYRLPSDRRGIVRIGPLEVVVTDPFGLTSVRTPAAGRAELTVFPRIDHIRPPRQAAGPDPTTGAVHPSALGRSGDEFYALRPYVVGDDLRQVHWASTARTGELVVRQNELPWQGRTTVVLDQRRGVHGPGEFERAVSAAASILEAAWHRGDLVRLAATAGLDTGLGTGHAHREVIMEQLAVITTSNRADPARAVGQLEHAGASGALLFVTGEVRPSELRAVRREALGFASFTAVTFAPGDRGATPAEGLSVLRVPPGATFASVWQDAGSRRRRVGAVRG